MLSLLRVQNQEIMKNIVELLPLWLFLLLILVRVGGKGGSSGLGGRWKHGGHDEAQKE